MNGFDVIGYARKSPTKISDCNELFCQTREEREREREITKNMISCLQSRSQVKDAYVSPSGCSKSPVAARDMTTNKDYTNISGCIRYTQYNFYKNGKFRETMIRSINTLFMYLSSTTKQVCLIIVDYAALSTDPDNILLLVKCVFIP